MIDKEKIHQILSSLWKNDDSVDKAYYNQALQDVQTAIDLQEESVSEDLEDAASSFARKDSEGISNLANFYYTVADKARIFKVGANWQKEKDIKYFVDNHKQIFNNGYEEGFEAGRDDMEDEMTKDSIPAEIMQNKYGNKYISSWAGLCQYDEFKVGDKIKIKIIDEN